MTKKSGSIFMNELTLGNFQRISRGLIMSTSTLSLLVGCAGEFNANSSYESRLASHLTETGAVMYGAYWCPHCGTQKDMFKGAATDLPYIECDPDGEDSKAELCLQKNIEGYPTWEIKGQFYPGVQSLSALAELSSFESTQP